MPLNVRRPVRPAHIQGIAGDKAVNMPLKAMGQGSCVRVLHALCFSLLVCLLSCAPAHGAGSQVYHCDDGSQVQVFQLRGSETVIVSLGDSAWQLPRVPAASGAKYSDGSLTFWTKGRQATVICGNGTVLRSCQLARSSRVMQPQVLDLLNLPVRSSSVLDVGPFNQKIKIAAEAGRSWPMDPLQVALEFVSHRGGSLVAISRLDERAEAASETVVTIVREGLLDDSVRAVRDELDLVRAEDGSWRLEKARRAFRCYRGPQQTCFGQAVCR